MRTHERHCGSLCRRPPACVGAPRASRTPVSVGPPAGSRIEPAFTRGAGCLLSLGASGPVSTPHFCGTVSLETGSIAANILLTPEKGPSAAHCTPKPPGVPALPSLCHLGVPLLYPRPPPCTAPAISPKHGPWGFTLKPRQLHMTAAGRWEPRGCAPSSPAFWTCPDQLLVSQRRTPTELPPSGTHDSPGASPWHPCLSPLRLPLPCPPRASPSLQACVT